MIMSITADSDYTNRRTGLIVFGIFEMLLGGLCALFIPLMLFAQTVAARRPGGAQPMPFLGTAIAVYAGVAILFVWLGIGSALARRWARALWLCLSAVGLCFGAMGCVFMIWLLPHLGETMAGSGQPTPPPGMLATMRIVAGLVMLVIYILIPGALFLFYRSPNVKRTCEVLDPVERWTDRCPLPVLALSLLLSFAGLGVVSFVGVGHSFPFFGFSLEGPAHYLASVLIVALLFGTARGLYKLRPGAWWTALGLQVVLGLSNFVTSWRGDFTHLYVKMGYSAQISANASQLMNAPAFKWLVPLGIVPWIVWLLWIRRYFLVPPLATKAEG